MFQLSNQWYLNENRDSGGKSKARHGLNIFEAYLSSEKFEL